MSKSKVSEYITDEYDRLKKRSDLWEFLNKNYNLVEAKDLEIFFSLVKPTYQYFEDFISFAKAKDKKICMTAIPVIDLYGAAQVDINTCLQSYGEDPSSGLPILYVYRNLDDKHGDLFKEVYLIFLCENEESLLKLFFKFEKLKVFL